MSELRLISEHERQLKPLVMEETMDYAEWIGEHRMLERLLEKAETLRGIRSLSMLKPMKID